MKFYRFFLCVLFLGRPSFLEASDVSNLWNFEDNAAFFSAIASGEHGAVESLLKGGFMVTATNEAGKTAFSVAIEHNKVEVLKVLLRFKGDLDLNKKFSGDKFPLLHQAASLDHVEILKLLIENGASPQGLKGGYEHYLSTNHNGAYYFHSLDPIRVAFLFKSYEVIRALVFEYAVPLPSFFLIKGCTINDLSLDDVLEKLGDQKLSTMARNFKEALRIFRIKKEKALKAKTVEEALRVKREKEFFRAAREGTSEEFIKALEEASLENCFQEGWHPLHIAVLQGQEEVLSLLVEKGRVNPDVRGPGGLTALHLAAHFGKISILRRLVALEASVDEKTNVFLLGKSEEFKIERRIFNCSSQSSALSLAVGAKNEEAVTALVEAGAGDSNEARSLLRKTNWWLPTDPSKKGVRKALRKAKNRLEEARETLRREFREKEKARAATAPPSKYHGGSKKPSAPTIPYASEVGGRTPEDPVEGKKVEK